MGKAAGEKQFVRGVILVGQREGAICLPRFVGQAGYGAVEVLVLGDQGDGLLDPGAA